MSRPLIDASRLDAFTDGIFAIAATLLVLELTTHSIGKVSTSGQLWAGFVDMGDQFISFAVSFLLLCLLWMAHVQQFVYIARVDNKSMWINVGRLLFIVLIPFSTVVDAEYDSVWLGRMILPASFFPAILMGWLSWVYVCRHRELLVADIEQADIDQFSRRSLTAVVLSAISVLLSPFVGAWAFLAFALDPVIGAIGKRHQSASAEKAE